MQHCSKSILIINIKMSEFCTVLKNLKGKKEKNKFTKFFKNFYSKFKK